MPCDAEEALRVDFDLKSTISIELWLRQALVAEVAFTVLTFHAFQ